MKRVLRSIIDFDGTITQDNLCNNLQKLVGSRLEWTRPDDKKICDFIKQYFQTRLEVPSKSTICDYFERLNDNETLERIKDIEAQPQAYIRTNFTHLVHGLVEEQNKMKAIALLQESKEIMSGKGLTIDGEVKRGLREGIRHFAMNANNLITSESNSKIRGTLRADGQQVWEEYEAAKYNSSLAWGKFTGLNEIDKICHGIKKGELWMHAAYAGELKCGRASDTVFDHRTKRRRALGEMFESGDLPILTALYREGETFRLVEAEASHLVQNGIRDIYRLQLSSGKYVDATSNHKFFTPSGWVELGDLSPGNFVAVPRKISVSSPRNDFSDSQVSFVGYMLGDGHLATCSTYLDFAATNPAIASDFERVLVELGMTRGVAEMAPMEWYRERCDQKGWKFSAHSQSVARELIEKLGLWGVHSSEKSVPDEFFGLPEDQVALLLGALWSTDGSCHAKDHVRLDRRSLCRRNDISYGSTSHRLCLDIQSLLLRLGIRSSVTTVKTTYKGDPYTFYCVRIVGNDSKRTFTSKIRVIGKEDRFARLASRIPVISGRAIPSEFLPKNRKVQTPKGYKRYSNTVKRRPTVTVEEARKFATPQDGQLLEALDGDLDWESVQSVTFCCREMTYDLSVPEHHSFVVNDIVSHNTTFATTWCYNLITRYRTNVFYASLEMKYEHIRKLIFTMHSTNSKFRLQGYKPLDYRKVRDGGLTAEEEAFFKIVVEDFCTNPDYGQFDVWAPDEDVTPDDIRMEAELNHKNNEIGLLVIDHGGLVEPRKKKRNKEYTIELNSVIRDTKKMALHFNHGESIPILLLFQINRQGKLEAEKNEGRYRMSALSYANEAERSADVVTTTYLDPTHRQNNTTRFCNLKNRDNPQFEPFDATVDFAARRITNTNKFAEGGGIAIDDARAIANNMRGNSSLGDISMI